MILTANWVGVGAGDHSCVYIWWICESHKTQLLQKLLGFSVFLEHIDTFAAAAATATATATGINHHPW
ncbi:hypothetical protein EYC80_005148 [Monilinia laxa]|uniref:Uncharacterized protein n=1 Tax=Monilinia laxa TaxID=61186 RepID=A0A5N6KJ08_MONLA|nr:hypothetical protein EYC80_005148 [Monilinia laxa]